MNIIPSTSSGHETQAHNPIAINAAKQELSAIRTLDNLSNKILPYVISIAAVVLVATASVAGPLGIAAAGAAITAFEAGRAYMHNRADLNRELALYHKDIARVLGKPAESVLTLQDMRDAADEKKVGDKAIKPLKAELDHLAYRSRFNYTSGISRAIITTLTTGLLGSAMQVDFTQLGTGLFYQITGAIGMSAGINAGIESMTNKNFERNKPPSIYTELVKIQEASQRQNISAEPVFEVILKLDKKLCKEIEKTYGMPYQSLTSRNKKRVIEHLEDRIHAKKLAEFINEGASVTSIPLLISGQLDPSKLPQKTEENDTKPESLNTIGKSQQKSFAAKIKHEREMSDIEGANVPISLH